MAEVPQPAEVDSATGAAVATRFHCAQCGAELEYRPGTEHLRCPYCGLINEIADANPVVEELDYHEFLAKLQEGSEFEESPSIRCGACGAVTDRPEDLDAYRCVFCHSDILAADSSARIIKPRSLLPFAMTKQQAHQQFRKWVRSLWFAPTKIKRFAQTGGRLDGAYIPYWTYDSRTISRYTGERGEYYWVNETYTTTQNGKRVTRTRRVRKTRWYPASGVVRNAFDDLLVLGSQSLPEYAVHLDPWDLEKLTPYKHEYMAGFRAERYQVGLDEGFVSARKMMEDPIHRSVLNDIGGDTQRVHSIDTKYRDITFKHILLPIWISAYRYRNKAYRFLVNGRTGELQGERPYSPWKIAGAIIGGLVAVGLILLLWAVIS